MAGPQEIAKTAGDVASVGVLGATLMKWLPAVAALFTIAWTAIRIYETRTVRKAVHWIRQKRKD